MSNSHQTWQSVLGRVLLVFGAVSHLGSLLGLLVPLIFAGPSIVFAEQIPMTLNGLLRDLMAIGVAVLSFVTVEAAIKLIPVLIILAVVYALLWINYVSVGSGVAVLIFGLAIYIPALLLLRKDHFSEAV